MVTQAPKRSSVLAAIAFCLSCIGLMIFVWTQFAGTIPFAPVGYRVHAVFPETGQLVPGADVRISGVNVGKVTKVQPQGVNSLVTMDLKQRFSPIPSDTRATVRLKTLLGEAYIQLSTGSRSSGSLPDNGTIPKSQVEPTQNLDQVLNSFDPSTQRALQSFLNGTFTALSGRGQDLNNAVGNLDPTLTDLAAVVGVLNQQQGNVRGVINNLSSVLNTLGGRSADLQSLVGAGDQVLSATAVRDSALTATVNGLPPFMAQLRTTLATLNTTLGIARPTLSVIRGAAPLVRPALTELIQLSSPALSLLTQAPALVRDANRALPAISRFTTAFNGALSPLLSAARQVVPIINYIELYSREVGAGFGSLAGDLNASAPTANGVIKYLRAGLVLNNESLFGQPQRPSTNRHNPIVSPGELANVARRGLESSDCNNLANTSLTSLLPLGTGNVTCTLQPAFPWPRSAASNGPSYYPRLTQARP